MNYYELLGVPRDADEKTIKRAYRKLAQKAHPDRPGGDETKMAALAVAYETLTSPERRARYDQTGDTRAHLPSIDQQAHQAIMHLFGQLAEQMPEHGDIIEEIKNQIRKNQGQMRDQIEAGRKLLAAFEQRRARLKHKGEGRNFIDDFLAERIAQLREQPRMIGANIEIGSRAIELLQAYQDNPPPQAAATWVRMYPHMTSATGF
jgi:curved DNA-binding protein CbpA